MVGLTALRTQRGLSKQALANLMVPPVTVSAVSRLESGRTLASTATLMDLARIFGSIEIEDELSNRYTLVYRGKIPTPLDDLEWPTP